MITFLLTIFFLTACSLNSGLEIKSEVDEIKVSNFKDFGALNEDYHMLFIEEEDIKIFVNAIEKSKPVKGDVDMPKGDYNFVLCFNEGTSEGFHLWISDRDSTGMIMKIDDTTTAYKLTKSSKNKILSLISK